MFDFIIINFFINLLILTFIFWIIVIVGEKFLHKEKNKVNREIYECGFLNINKLTIVPNFAFLIIAILLIIYDLEFFFLIPLSFNMVYLWNIHFFIINTIYFGIIISFIFDWQSISLNWFS